METLGKGYEVNVYIKKSFEDERIIDMVQGVGTDKVVKHPVRDGLTDVIN